MLTAQSPVTGDHLLRPKPHRRPLQPINPPANLPPTPVTTSNLKPNLNLGWTEILNDTSNKENPNTNLNPSQKADANQNQNSSSSICPAPARIELLDASLADELIAIREKMERLRLDKEKTEKMLRERELMMEMKMKELDQRGEVQKELEIEVDRLYRLNELRSLCNRILPIRSMREKEKEKIKQDKPQEGKAENEEEKGEGRSGQKSPCLVIDSEKSLIST